VTSVGATTYSDSESAATLSAGGFSNFFASPLYQVAQTAAYKTSIGTTYAGRYNPAGRGYPDVAAQGERIAIVHNREGKLIEGTSASAPIFASVIALINDRLVSRGRSTLGFLNPWLYANPQAFNDIARGKSILRTSLQLADL
jgi:tripeptidyl-peptidase I